MSLPFSKSLPSFQDRIDRAVIVSRNLLPPDAEWISNCPALKEEEYVRDLSPEYLYFFGTPRATTKHSSARLVYLGMVGVYRVKRVDGD